MYKATQSNQDFLLRVGSHSTKGKRNGHVSILPPNAKDATFEALRERRDEASAVLERARERLAAAKDAMRGSDRDWRALHSARGRGEFVRTPDHLRKQQDEKAAAHAEMKSAEARVADLNIKFHAEYAKRYETIFVLVARAILDQSTIDRIEQVIFEEVGRPRPGWFKDRERDMAWGRR